ncbi:MAG: YesU family protein [Treponema sp.]|nr:YesU family protein [Treponema sp.]
MYEDLVKELLYENPFEKAEDIANFKMEGSCKISFPNSCMRMENALDASLGQKSNYVFWCDKKFPSDIVVEWDFKPLSEPGLAMLFFAADGKDGKDLFDESFKKRTGEYQMYHHGDMNAFHVSYFRRKQDDERSFHTCNLRKSYGFYLVSQGADPIPDADEAKDFYHISLYKKENKIRFAINNLELFQFEDDGKTYGSLLKDGYIGFRQMAPLVAEYRNLKVYSV